MEQEKEKLLPPSLFSFNSKGMNGAAAKIQPEDHPLDLLSGLLGHDMQRVNGLILQSMHSDVELIPRLAAYLIAAGGKRIRPLLTLGCTRLYGYQGDRPYALAASVEFIHTATLLHDDVVDESIERRGNPSANIVFGNQASVLVGDFLFSRAFQLMVADGSLDVLRILSHASAVIAEGEVLQLAAANNLDTTMEGYLNILGAKTAALFAAACEIGPVIAGSGPKAQKSMREFGYNLGMAFQIADDILDYTADQTKLGKTVGDDFREGKLTAPVLLALSKADETERAFWSRTMEKMQQNDGDLQTAIAILNRHHAFEAGMAMAQDYTTKAKQALMTGPESAIRDAMGDIIDFSIERRH